MDKLQLLKKRLLYQSQHRGIKEMDLLLGAFAEKFIRTMEEKELKQFEALLSFSDPILYSWFFEKAMVLEDDLHFLVQKITKFRQDN